MGTSSLGCQAKPPGGENSSLESGRNERWKKGCYQDEGAALVKAGGHQRARCRVSKSRSSRYYSTSWGGAREVPPAV